MEIQYHFFHPFNGGFAIRDDLNEKLGTHEGGWELTTVSCFGSQ